MKKLQSVRGTHDLFGEEMQTHLHIINIARKITSLAGYSDFSTPIFEFSEVFHRTLGDSSDVITKETYNFTDRGGLNITLRPEFTASIIRAFISNGLQQNLPFKAFYAGAAFRYERPQKGRQRQFHQIGIEMLGANSPFDDVESILSAKQTLDALGVGATELELNSLGCTESRANYRIALVKYLEQHKTDLSPESLIRLEKNPLRILDSKQEADKKIIENAPILQDYFTEEAKNWFSDVKNGLTALNIPYKISPKLVRGLDYYSHIVFEFTSNALGSQATILAGGRYNDLIAQMGGKNIAGIGWAAGIERLAMLINRENISTKPRPITIIPLKNNMKNKIEDGAKNETENTVLSIANILRKNNKYIEIIRGGNIGKCFKKSDKINATHAIIIGEDEIKSNNCQIKDLQTGKQETINIEYLMNYFT